MSERYSLLPANASALERAFERAFAEILEGIEAPFPELLDPTRTPEAMLPYLAQDRGVTEWEAAASETLRRRTVTNVWPIRRQAGTREALVLAVDELDYDAEVVAWYDENAEFTEPYQLEVIAWKRGNAAIDQGITEQMLRNLEYAKSERDELTLTLAMGVSSHFQAVAVFEPGVMSREDEPAGEILASPLLTGPLAPIAIVGPATTTTDDYRPGRILASPVVAGLLGVAGGAYMSTVTDHNPRATI